MRRTILALTACSALAIAACGSDNTPTSTGSAAGPGDDEAQLEFARCMRENGVNISDPKGGGNGPRRVEIERGTSPQTVERATKTCREKTGGGPPELTDDQREELQDAALKFARCMRQNGINIPDPQVGGSGGGAVLFRAGPNGQRRGNMPNPQSPAFQKAERACRQHMPQIRRGGDGVAVGARPGS